MATGTARVGFFFSPCPRSTRSTSLHALPVYGSLTQPQRCLWYILIRVATSATNRTTVRGLLTLSPVGIFSVASESPEITLAVVARNRTPPIFLSCLQKCTPSHCPVCRGVYRRDKIKKLHVETTVNGRDEITRALSPSTIAEYLQMVAMVSGGGVLDVEIENVSARVDGWIAALPQNLILQVSCCFFFCIRTLCAAFDHFFFRGSTIVDSWIGDGYILALEWLVLTKSRAIVTTGPPCARFSQAG